jgi:hypothetical protein
VATDQGALPSEPKLRTRVVPTVITLADNRASGFEPSHESAMIIRDNGAISHDPLRAQRCCRERRYLEWLWPLVPASLRRRPWLAPAERPAWSEGFTPVPIASVVRPDTTRGTPVGNWVSWAGRRPERSGGERGHVCKSLAGTLRSYGIQIIGASRLGRRPMGGSPT